MNKIIKSLSSLIAGLCLAIAGFGTVLAGMPAPLDDPGKVKIALVRYLSTGDFFQAYLGGVESQAEAIGVDLRVFDSRQDAALQADMVDQAIALGVDGIIIENFGDVPFVKNDISKRTLASFTSVVQKLEINSDLKVGINVLRND